MARKQLRYPDQTDRIVDGSLEFRLLGEMTVLDRRGEISLGHARRRSLLAVLLVDVGRVVPTDQIVDRMWGGDAPASARNIISGYAVRLRAALGTTLGEGTDAAPLRRQAGGYLISAEPDAVDLHRFHRLTAAARECADPREGAVLLGEALALHRGPAFHGLASPWLEHQSGIIGEEVWSAQLDRADLLLRLGQHAAMVPGLRDWADERPLDERLAGQLMTALYRAGQQAEAIAAYHQMRDRLADQLGVDPGPQLSELYQQILKTDPALNAPPPAAGAAVTLNPVTPPPVTHRPQTQPAGPPPGRSGTELPAELPHDVRDFTGRASDLARLDAALATDSDEHPDHGVIICAIEGPAGVGKTALAVHWAHQIAGRFPDGQLYVNLHGYDQRCDPLEHSEALTQLLRSLGADPARIPEDPGEQEKLYRSLLAGKRTLILLDNALSAHHVRPLLPGTATCVVLITSRTTLTGIVASEGAHLLTLGPLSADEAGELLRRILGADRVAAEPGPTRRLAELCGHLPLALRIAAANLAAQPGRPITEAVQELAEGTRLTALKADGDEHVAVTSAFDLSYRALAADAGLLFRRLGLIPGPHVTAHAAAALTSASTEVAARALNLLAAAHLIERHPGGRYRFHDLIHLYAQTRAHLEDTPQQRREAFQRILRCYIETTTAAVGFINPNILGLPPAPGPGAGVPLPFEDRAGAQAWLRSERPNLLAAVQEASATARHEAWRLAYALYGFFAVCTYPADWLACAEAGLRAARSAGDPQAQAAMHNSLAHAHWRLGHYAQAIKHGTQGSQFCRQSGWRPGEAAVAGVLGNVCWELCEFADAVGHYRAALAIHRDTGYRYGEGLVLGNLGLVHKELGKLHDAVGHYRTALAIHRDTGYRFGEANVSSNLGNAFRELGLSGQAREHLARSVAVHQEIGCRNGEAASLEFLARVHLDTGRYEQAVERAHRALALADDVGDRRIEADARNTLGVIYQNLGQHHKALDMHRCALRIARTTGNQRSAAEALAGLAAACRCLDRVEEARAYGNQALAVSRGHRLRVIEGQALVQLAMVQLQQGSLAEAITCSRDALAIQRQNGHRLGQARALHILGTALRASSDAGAARSCWMQALRIFTEIDSPEAGPVRAALAEVQPRSTGGPRPLNRRMGPSPEDTPRPGKRQRDEDA